MSWGVARYGTDAVTVGSFTAAGQTSSAAGTYDAKGFNRWTFQVTGSITGGGITVQGTLDGTNYFDLTPISTNASTGQNVNPIVSTDAQLIYEGTLAAVRGVSNGAFVGSAVLKVLATQY